MYASDSSFAPVLAHVRPRYLFPLLIAFFLLAFLAGYLLGYLPDR